MYINKKADISIEISALKTWVEEGIRTLDPRNHNPVL